MEINETVALVVIKILCVGGCVCACELIRFPIILYKWHEINRDSHP